MLDYAQIEALAAVLRAGSFDAAAAELRVTPSAVSQRIKALEEKVGAVLVVRSQPCRATAAGARLARHAEEVRLLEALAVSDLGQRPEAIPQVRIAVNADSLATWFLPALAAVPDLLFEIVIDDQDHSADLLRKGEVAAAVTGHPGPVQGCDTVSLGALRYLATASPGFAARWFPEGLTHDAAARAPGLTFNTKDRLQSLWLEERLGRRVSYRGHVLPSSTAFVEAALAGIGWGMNPECLVAAHVAAGRLVALLPDAPLDTPLHWQTSRATARALAPLTRAVRAAAARVLVAPPADRGPGHALDRVMERMRKT